MSNAWFDPNYYAWIPGTLLGVAGGIEGTLVGICGPRGKLKSLVFAFHFGVMGACFLLLVTGLTAWLQGQPYGVWYGLGFPGLLGLLIFGSLTPVVRNAYRQAELRKSMAKDL